MITISLMQGDWERESVSVFYIHTLLTTLWVTF